MRWLGAVLIAVVLTAGIAGAASTALVLRFSQTTAAAGDTVVARTAGRPFGALRRPRPRVFLISAEAAASVRSARDGRLRLLGALRVDRSGAGKIAFQVPYVPPGEYTTLVWCRTCGRRLVPTGPFPGPFRVKPALRNCESSVYGDLPSDWARNSARTGPIALVGVAGYPARYFEPRKSDGRIRPVKVLIVVENGTTVTLAIPPAERRFVAMSYDRSSPVWNESWVRVGQGQPAVTFEGCAPGDCPHMQFNGGFIVAGPRCARLHVEVQGRPEAA